MNERSHAYEIRCSADNEELTRRPAREQAQGSTAGASFFASLFLPPGIARGSAARPRLTIPPPVRTARLQIGLERGDDFNRYRVELSTAQGRQVWAQDRLRPQSGRAGRIILLTVPGNMLNAGPYELTLKGVTEAGQTEDVRYYYFDVLKK